MRKENIQLQPRIKNRVIMTLYDISRENSNPLNLVMRGMLYEKTCDIRKSITKFDDFTFRDPDLFITHDLTRHIHTLVKEKL